MKKKIVLIACGMLLALAGCGKDNNTVGGVTLEPVPASEDTQVVEEAPAQTQEETPAQESEDKTAPARQDGYRYGSRCCADNSCFHTACFDILCR